MTAPAQALAPDQAAFEAYQAVRWPYGGHGTVPWNHPALDKARPAWAAAAKAAAAASPDLATARNALSDLAELHLRTVEDLAAVTAEIDPAKLDMLADWFDVDDLAKGRPGRTEVQEDLRRWAKLVRDARKRAGLPS